MKNQEHILWIGPAIIVVGILVTYLAGKRMKPKPCKHCGEPLLNHGKNQRCKKYQK